MTKHARWIDTPGGVREVAERLRQCDVIALDTEFIRETTFFPKIALIQLATADEAWLLDPVKLDRDAMAPVLDVLTDTRVLKILHAAFADQECLYWAYGVVAEPVFDTAVAAALCGIGDNAGLAKLLKEVCRVHLPKGRARVKWLTRPLPTELMHYAEQDVAHLVELGLSLQSRMDRLGRREWALTESRIEASAFDVTPEEAAFRMARGGSLDAVGYAVLAELVRWRDGRAKQADLPRAWVAGNEVLISLAKVRPDSLSELKSFRGLSAKELDRHGDRLLASIRRGLEDPSPALPQLPKNPPPPSENEDHALILIRTYLAYLGARFEVAPRLLLGSGRAYELFLASGLGTEEWVRLGILGRYSADLIGEELEAFLCGRRALTLRDGKVEILTYR